MMKLGVFGGSFDLVHLGHVSIANHACHEFKLDRVLLVPAYRSPHKANTDYRVGSHHRMKMLKIASMPYSNLEICNLEIEKKGISYTIDTLEALREKYFQSTIYLIMGEDTYHQFSSWESSKNILSIVEKILVAPRDEGPLTSKLIRQAEWIGMPQVTVSSTKVRECLGKSLELSEGLLNEKVLEYISQNHLYADCENQT